MAILNFMDIAKINQAAVEQMTSSIISSIDDVLAVDKQARELAASLIKKVNVEYTKCGHKIRIF